MLRPTPPALRRSLAVALLATAALSAGGCVVAAVAAGAAAAIGAVKYDENEAWRDFREDLPTTWKATIESLRANGFPVADGLTHGPLDGKIEAGDATAVVEVHPGELTRVRIRVGTFKTDDNRRRAALVLESIAKRLD